MSERIQRLVAGNVKRAAMLRVRSDAASSNELHTAIMAAEDVIDPRSACGVIEFKPVGEEPEKFDEFTGPWGGGSC